MPLKQPLRSIPVYVCVCACIPFVSNYAYVQFENKGFMRTRIEALLLPCASTSSDG